jgi:putative tricarboxylic transport membrane protein
MILTGLLLSMVGSDLETAPGVMTFDIADLSDGIGFTNVAMGLFGFRLRSSATWKCRRRAATS